jgi:hypothetical protein
MMVPDAPIVPLRSDLGLHGPALENFTALVNEIGAAVGVPVERLNLYVGWSTATAVFGTVSVSGATRFAVLAKWADGAPVHTAYPLARDAAPDYVALGVTVDGSNWAGEVVAPYAAGGMAIVTTDGGTMHQPVALDATGYAYLLLPAGGSGVPSVQIVDAAGHTYPPQPAATVAKADPFGLFR